MTARRVTGEAADEVRALVPDIETLGSGWPPSTTWSTRARHGALPGRRLQQPLLLEGEPGVGKTAAAKALAAVLGTPLIRLQCYEGLDAAEALYEWNYQRQLLAIRLAESRRGRAADADLFSRGVPHRRGRCCGRSSTPGPCPPVLLIDEIDRADDEFEALLLEFLGEASVTIPELGTFTATRRRSSSSPPTAAATCTTRCGGAACTTGSTSLTLDVRLR